MYIPKNNQKMSDDDTIESVLLTASVNVTREYVSFYENSTTFHIIQFKDVSRVSMVKYPIKNVLVIRNLR